MPFCLRAVCCPDADHDALSDLATALASSAERLRETRAIRGLRLPPPHLP